jgi:hypothetical protein
MMGKGGHLRVESMFLSNSHFDTLVGKGTGEEGGLDRAGIVFGHMGPEWFRDNGLSVLDIASTG